MPIGFNRPSDRREYDGIVLVAPGDDLYFSKVGKTIIQTVGNGTIAASYVGMNPGGYMVTDRHIGEKDGKVAIINDIKLLKPASEITISDKDLESFIENFQKAMDRAEADKKDKDK
ncbi:hypothetical protein COU62_01470 [Candidatus Pacearchaeota archaeon CG10_big_fil_rev_8_21_14_0_10_35_219]|nr:hypothetical protein [Candidatus Pacearchaeota archaeon]OIO43393.1 MAG: hypothetical protein AUJ63_00695 [Candidatus Pacearchaeota archaeon CG1_02_35_32]PIO08037.1 MAG: hypothetical protein COU62_01470 [Candidatus Pacearchaeota archaeon CG10_big_fil_rev_8_21_14_0_10_35_219]PIY81549.1 MAG: hypothetical protein COY79_02310 [Candidatus Pacearchaeota archaeon CG_4_10_14_0_8_um_filter_35_169]PIZ78924.1 MAG: hypothetical protein COY00_04695 [Candidatus Pacearchaeota archaeon CG_4_10_14_0_2_um_filt